MTPHASPAGFLSRLGFDPARLGFALRTALAACAALVVAWALGLQHPQWSAMTVWAAAQPVRGLLIEKGLFRALGTAVGVLVGIGLVVATGGQPVPMITGLSLWIGLCAGLGNLLRGFSSYGSILAGYSAAMVALLDTPHPDQILGLGLDRFLTVMTGVLVAVLVGLVFTPQAAESDVAGRIRRLVARCLRDFAARLRGAAADTAARRALLSELAAVDDLLDTHGAGSLRLRRAAPGLRGLVVAQVALL
ncbi:MAG: FUSC family protein, partial [Ferrovibrionaceae bacterium]